PREPWVATCRCPEVQGAMEGARGRRRGAGSPPAGGLLRGLLLAAARRGAGGGLLLRGGLGPAVGLGLAAGLRLAVALRGARGPRGLDLAAFELDRPGALDHVAAVLAGAVLLRAAPEVLHDDLQVLVDLLELPAGLVDEGVAAGAVPLQAVVLLLGAGGLDDQADGARE